MKVFIHSALFAVFFSPSSKPMHHRVRNVFQLLWVTSSKCLVHILLCFYDTDILEITPAPNNGSHGSLNHMLRSPYYKPQPLVEQSAPGQCPLTSLKPADQLGCSCNALVHTCISQSFLTQIVAEGHAWQSPSHQVHTFYLKLFRYRF